MVAWRAGEPDYSSCARVYVQLRLRRWLSVVSIVIFQTESESISTRDVRYEPGSSSISMVTLAEFEDMSVDTRSSYDCVTTSVH